MIEIILEAITYFFAEIIFEGLILGTFRAIKLMGFLILKLLTLNKHSLEEIEEKYRDSSKPYFIGYGIVATIIYLIIQ